MHKYEYTDADGDTLRIMTGYTKGETVVQIDQKRRLMGVNVANSDIPTVAAELLKAAGLEAIIVLHAGDEAAKSVEEGAEAALSIAAELLRAAGYSELADRIDPKVTQEAEKKMQERRDALAQDLNLGWAGYDACSPGCRRAIDRIIELEDGK